MTIQKIKDFLLQGLVSLIVPTKFIMRNTWQKVRLLGTVSPPSVGRKNVSSKYILNIRENPLFSNNKFQSDRTFRNVSKFHSFFVISNIL